VTVGRDNFVFEAGPFNTIALGCLTNRDWVCDFDAVLSSDKALLLQIPRALYQEAVNTSHRIVNQVGNPFKHVCHCFNRFLTRFNLLSI
jgi:hypothetical protein